jgi:putative DNA primase/helicase
MTNDAHEDYCDEALAAVGMKPNGKASETIASDEITELAELSELDYQQCRKGAAKHLGISVAALDKLVRQKRAQAEEDEFALPHWQVEPWPVPVDCAELLDAIWNVFSRYIVLPPGGADALALWVLHAWTYDSGEISPFIVLVSPTKRCGKTSTLIVLLYLTPRSELASNISPSAMFRYVEDKRPTLLMDEGDSFIGESEEVRGILNSGHTKAAAYVIRNVEVSGEHKPRRFSTWAPKAIASIRKLADTLQDRSIIIEQQRKPKGAKVERLRRRDNDEFAVLRRKAARWASDNMDRLVDPDPPLPETLNDRAADNWRPLLAIADLASEVWGERARQAARVLSGDDGDDSAVNVRLLADIREAFGQLDVIRSADLIVALMADPEKPWAEWRHGKPITQKQLAGLLRPFGIISEEVHPHGQSHGKGYKRGRFEEVWERYLPGQNAVSSPVGTSEARNRANADGTGTSRIFSSARENNSRGSKNDNLSYSHVGLRACADRSPESGSEEQFDHKNGGADTTATTEPDA